jgi:DnaA-homolog protein
MPRSRDGAAQLMKQIPLPIGPVPDPSFSSYLSQANIEAVAHLAALRPLDLPVYLWGPSGSGKTHLLRASLLARQERGERCGWWDAAVPGDWELQDDWTAVALDNCDQLDALGQSRAFAQFEMAKAAGVQWLAAGRFPPVDLPVREDLRTRFSWGLVFALRAPQEHEIRAALRLEADRRGLFLSDDVMGFLMTRFERDLSRLMALLARLDEFALTMQRAITVPLLKQMLREEPEETLR